MAPRSTRPRRPITGPLRAIPDPPIQTGFSSRRAAAERRPRASCAGPAAAAILLAIFAIALAYGRRPRRFGLGPVVFARLSGWTRDHISAAVPVFLKSCARFKNRADVAPLDAGAASGCFGRGGGL